MSPAKIPRKRSVVEMLDLQKEMNDKFDKNGLKMRDEMDEPAAMGRRGGRRRKCGKGIT